VLLFLFFAGREYHPLYLWVDTMVFHSGIQQAGAAYSLQGLHTLQGSRQSKSRP
jgi:hypothetical protein